MCTIQDQIVHTTTFVTLWSACGTKKIAQWTLLIQDCDAQSKKKIIIIIIKINK